MFLVVETILHSTAISLEFVLKYHLKVIVWLKYLTSCPFFFIVSNL